MMKGMRIRGGSGRNVILDILKRPTIVWGLSTHAKNKDRHREHGHCKNHKSGVGLLNSPGETRWTLTVATSSYKQFIHVSLSCQAKLNSALQSCRASLVAQTGKESTCNAGGLGFIPGLRRSLGEENGNPLQYSCLENFTARGAWWDTARGVAKSRMWLSCYTVHDHLCMESDH